MTQSAKLILDYKSEYHIDRPKEKHFPWRGVHTFLESAQYYPWLHKFNLQLNPIDKVLHFVLNLLMMCFESKAGEGVSDQMRELIAIQTYRENYCVVEKAYHLSL